MTHLFIVTRQSPDVSSHLAREFASEPDVAVIVDRRRGERRARSERHLAERPDRRQTDRRVGIETALQLATLGYAFVRLPDAQVTRLSRTA